MNAARIIRACLGVFVCAGGAYGQPTERTLFVTNRDSGTVSSLRLNHNGTLSLVGTFAVGPLPQDCALTQDGDRLVVLNSNPDVPGSATVKVMYVNADGTLTVPSAPVVVGDAPLGLGLSQSGYVLVPSTAQRDLASLRLLGMMAQPVSTAPAGTFPIRSVATPDSQFAYCISSISPDDVVTYSLGADGVLSRLGALDIPGAAAFGAVVHPSGNTLYVSTGQANTINWYAINPSTGALTPGGSINPGGNSVTEMAITPDGRWLLSVHVLSDTVQVTRINADGSLTPTAFSAFVTSDARDVVTDGRFVYVSDETPLGGAVGIHMFSIHRDFGFLTALGPPAHTGGFKPQFMALWSPPPCEGDADGNGVINFMDITSVLTHFGMPGPVGDANFDGVVTFGDISTILMAWGNVCGG